MSLDNLPWKEHTVTMHSVGHLSGFRGGRSVARRLVGPVALSFALLGGSAALASPAFAAVQADGPGYGPTSTLPQAENTVPPQNAVPATPTSQSSGLAFTGTDALLTTAVGAGAIGLGGIIVLSSRKRRRDSFSA